MRITAIAQLCRAFNFVKRIDNSRCVLLLSSGKIHTLSILYEALKNQPKKKSGRAIALPAPAPLPPLHRTGNVYKMLNIKLDLYSPQLTAIKLKGVLRITQSNLKVQVFHDCMDDISSLHTFKHEKVNQNLMASTKHYKVNLEQPV